MPERESVSGICFLLRDFVRDGVSTSKPCTKNLHDRTPLTFCPPTLIRL
jgi:hypothetical protein